MWATIAGFGFGLGPVLGGALIEVFDWSAIFWVNVPIGLAGLLATLTHVRESRDPNARRLDLRGAALASGALFCLTLSLVETDDHAWTSAFTLAFLGAGVALGSAFLVFEAKHPEPMLPLDFFRRRAFTIANLDYCLMYAALAGVLFFVSLYFQNVKGFSALETGVSWLAMNVPFILVSPFAGRLQGRFGSRRSSSAARSWRGSECSTSLCSASTRPFSRPFPAISWSALATARPSRPFPPSRWARSRWSVRGWRPACSTRLGRLAVGLAALGSIATAVAAGSLSKPDDFVSGMRAAMLVAGALALAASVLTLVGQPRASRPAAG